MPIKGTRPRGKDKDINKKMKEELLSSKKDDAELAMIVDLERNDLGRVCNYNTVKVTEKKKLEEHPTVYHLVATVEGELHSRYDAIDLIKATFPGGSITGAPKVRAMQIIDELEPTKRSVYTGAMGYLSFNGNIDLNIAIRTFLVKDDHIFFQVGGGIVADSNPEDEYQETLHKARALIETLE
jgi:para-aminobenzoate synthetase component 1